jgi:hypothetical protein
MAEAMEQRTGNKEQGRLETEIGVVVQRSRRVGAEAAFRAGVEQRLQNLESQLGEVKMRLNGLLFFIASTVLAQVLERLLA